MTRRKAAPEICPLRGFSRSARKTVGERHSASKVLVDPDTGRILGAHLLGPHAEEMINLFALAIRHKLSRADIKKMIFAYPTHGSDIGYMV